MSVTDDSVRTQIEYMIRDKRHDEEKPYFLRYDTDGKIPRKNVRHAPHDISIHNFRSFQDTDNLQDYGFSVEQMGIVMAEEILNDAKSIKNSYYPVMEKLLWQKFPDAKSVHVLEHTVSLARDET
jgi:hypothetical protein